MVGSSRKNAIEPRAKRGLKKRSIANAAFLFAICATGAFSAPAQAQTWLNSAIGSVAGQVEQGVQQHILGNGTQPQPPTPQSPPPQNPSTSIPWTQNHYANGAPCVQGQDPGVNGYSPGNRDRVNYGDTSGYPTPPSETANSAECGPSN